MTKRISVVTPCFNEELNIPLIYSKIKAVFAGLSQYDYEHLFIDNSSTDKSAVILRKLAEDDSHVKVILNARNFGFARSQYYGLLQGNGDAVLLIVADLQDPPELIPELISKWEEGFKLVLGIKSGSGERKQMFLLRKLYYYIVANLSDSNIQLTQNHTGFGLYDQKVVSILRKIDDPNPYFRGLICEIGFESAKVEYTQPVRVHGSSSFNFYRLYDLAMLGITSYSKVPLRIATFLGFTISLLCFLAAIIYFIGKLLFWESYPVGTATLIIGLFLFSSLQMFFIGILGEYIAVVHTQTLRRPLVVEKERINFESDSEPRV